ncbi:MULTISPECIES: dipicolinate synthase subunit B [Clostridium]|uniref:dipicolinate synthase subunit B n=1 Tax=Clostridium TaxID=1485 RepID=UPI000A26D72C|nr:MULTISPECIES: dipicolinate synthase subunit B [Clostridium]MDU7336647.1 dipicolinate synthase subunit B [Clostridium sp.]
MSGLTIGYALTGSFCTFEKSVEKMRHLIEEGHKLIPIMSDNAYSTDTRFGRAQDWNRKIEELCDHEIWHTIVQVEPIGPKRLVDLILIAPCTGNTLAKLAHGITDTSVTMAAKSHLRVGGPVLLAMSTNDALSAAAQNVGRLMNTKNYYFVPMAQDDPVNKPTSVVADFGLLLPAALSAVDGKQLQPVYLK